LTRCELKKKILGKYDRIMDFADDIGYGRQQVSNIIKNKSVGRLEFWELARQKLALTYQEVWECMTHENTGGENHNGKQNK
jgi:hypothetical protein